MPNPTCQNCQTEYRPGPCALPRRGRILQCPHCAPTAVDVRSAARFITGTPALDAAAAQISASFKDDR
jgi:hypothetical protein